MPTEREQRMASMGHRGSAITCVKSCGKVFCDECIQLGGAAPCPECGRPTEARLAEEQGAPGTAKEGAASTLQGRWP